MSAQVSSRAMTVTSKPKYWTFEVVLIMAKSFIERALRTEGPPASELSKSLINGSGSVVSRIVLVLPLVLQLGLDDSGIVATA
jgi:hypothetical protein